MRAALRLISALFLITVLPLAAVAQEEEPYSGGTVPDTTISSDITVVVSGLTATFSVSGAGSCSWDFGDGEAGEGNPVTHTYADAGSYSVTATCGADQYDITANVGPLPGTGTEVSTYLMWGGGLLLVGATAVLAARRVKS